MVVGVCDWVKEEVFNTYSKKKMLLEKNPGKYFTYLAQGIHSETEKLFVFASIKGKVNLSDPYEFLFYRFQL